MHEILVSPRAKRDLIEIWLYTYDRWDERQADNYLEGLDHAISELAF